MPLDNFTLATFRKAEFGFLGVWVNTLMHTPLLNGEGYIEGLFFKTLKPKCKATPFFFAFIPFLGFLIN